MHQVIRVTYRNPAQSECVEKHAPCVNIEHADIVIFRGKSQLLKSSIEKLRVFRRLVKQTKTVGFKSAMILCRPYLDAFIDIPTAAETDL